MTNEEKINALKKSISLHFFIFFTIFQVIFNYTLTLMASTYIVSDLGGSSQLSIYSVAFYSVGNAIGVPLGGSFANKKGVSQLLVVCLILFAFCSLGCVLSSYYLIFLGFRFLQGLVSGPFYSLTNRLFSIFTPEDKKVHFSSILLTIYALGPVIGACFGGWISYDYEWKTLFYLNIPLNLITALFLWIKLKGISFKAPNNTFSWLEYSSFALSIFLLAFVIITGQELDWWRSKWINGASLIGSIVFVVFILINTSKKEPVIDLRLFKNRIFLFSIFNLIFLFSAYFGMVILLSQWLNLYADYTPKWIALLMGTMLFAAIIPIFLVENRVGQEDSRFPLLIAIVFFAVSCFHTILFNVEVDFPKIAFSRILAGFGLAFFLPPIVRLSFHSFPENKAVDVVIVFQIIRALSSGLGASLYLLLWNRRQVFFHERLGSQLTIYSQKVDLFFQRAKNIFLSPEQTLAELEYFLQRQSTALALEEVFYLMGWIMVGLIIGMCFTLFIPKNEFSPGKSPLAKLIYHENKNEKSI